MKLNKIISIAILGGGDSQRYYHKEDCKTKNKIFDSIYEGKPMYKIIYDKLKAFTDDIFLQGVDYVDNTNITAYPDIIRAKGPLGGIYSSLIHAQHHYVFVIAGDMPDVDTQILAEIERIVVNSTLEVDAVIPYWKYRSGYYEPLCALYSKNLISLIRELLDRDVLKVSNLFKYVKNIKYIEIEKLIAEGKLAPNCFNNINYKSIISYEQGL